MEKKNANGGLFIHKKMRETDETSAVRAHKVKRRIKLPKWCTRQITLSACGMYIGFVTVGIAHAMMGTTLLELQIQTKANLDQLTLLVTWSFLGRLLSTFVVGAIFDRLHPEMQMGVALMVCVFSSACIPLFTSYIWVAAAVTVQGLSLGFLSAGGSARCFDLWGDRVGPFLQALYFSFSVGGAITPSIVKPFLTKQTTSDLFNDTGMHSNDTDPLLKTTTYSMIQVTNTPSVWTDEDSSVSNFPHPGTFYPYLILVIIQTVVICYFAVLFSLDHCKPIRQNAHSGQNSKNQQKSKLNIGMLVLFCILFYCSVGMETTFGTLLYTYVVKHLGWDIEQGNNLATAFWVAFAVSRALGMVHSRFIPPELALTIFMSIMVTSFIVIAAMSHLSPIVMWICTPCVGVALSTQVANIYLYAGKHLTISGRTSGALMASLYLSGMTIPAFTGYLFKNVGMQWFAYIQLIFSAIMAIFFVVVRVWGRRMSTQSMKVVLNSNCSSDDEIEECQKLQIVNNQPSKI